MARIEAKLAFSRPERGLNTDEWFRFWRALEAEAGDAMFPLRLVETIAVESFSPPLFAALFYRAFQDWTGQTADSARRGSLASFA